MNSGTRREKMTVFLSHSTKDKEFVEQLATALEAADFKPWLCEVDIEKAKNLVARINDGLAQSDIVLLIWSPDAAKSAWTKEEWTAACDVIRPALKNQGLTWHGWHAFRRGLATNLHRLGVQDETIQRILRHSTVAVTQNCYIKTADADVVAAMRCLESAPRSLSGIEFVLRRINNLRVGTCL